MATFLPLFVFSVLFPFVGGGVSVEAKPITWTELGANGGLPKDLSTDVERCREIRDPPDTAERSAEAQRAGMGGLVNPELTDVLKGLLKCRMREVGYHPTKLDFIHHPLISC